MPTIVAVVGGTGGTGKTTVSQLKKEPLLTAGDGIAILGTSAGIGCPSLN